MVPSLMFLPPAVFGEFQTNRQTDRMAVDILDLFMLGSLCAL